ncbi:cytochrome oxidase maturation protein Cbb3 [Asticcacaulis sp. AC460]|nr:cbb3-type cytochrome oxidase assembly protein CcoS [Asticcacaulis sp. AC460]ESQ91056.1 cytochrome oxidase maturation protein Cbb3 [Asticcacaulis sp. AC460]
MAIFLVLIPMAFLLGLAGLAGLLWALNSGQYEDLEGHGARILKPDDDEQ